MAAAQAGRLIIPTGALAAVADPALALPYGRHRQNAAADRRRYRGCGQTARRYRGAHAADQCAGARRPARRAGVPEGRDAAAHRLVQVPRRLQQDCRRSRRSGARPAWWPIRPAIMRKAWRRRRACSACRATIVMPADAPRAEARAHRGARRRDRAVRPRHARTARPSPRRSSPSAAPRWCRLTTIR